MLGQSDVFQGRIRDRLRGEEDLSMYPSAWTGSGQTCLEVYDSTILNEEAWQTWIRIQKDFREI